MRFATTLLVALALFGTVVSHAATITSTFSGGDWNSTTTWLGGVVPANSDNAVIRAGASVTVAASATVNSLTFSNNNSSTAILTVNSGVTLTVTAGVTNQNSATTDTSVLIQGAGALNCASLAVGGTTTPTPVGSDYLASLTSSISNLSVSGSLNIKALYNSTQSAANQGTFALGAGTTTVGGSVVFVTVPLFGPILTLAAGNQSGTLTLSGATPFSFTGGGSSTFTPNGTNTTVIYSGAAQTVQPAAYQNLGLSGSGTKTTAGVTVTGTLFMRGTATASAAPTYGSGATLEYNGSAAQTSGPELVANIANLSINNTNGVTLAGSPTVGGILTLAAGKLTTGANQVNLATNGSVTGGNAASYVNGTLQKTFAAGTQEFVFPVGDNSSYAPLALSNLSVTTPGSLKASSAGGSHPQLGDSGLDQNRNVNRYWALSRSGGDFGAYSATFNYPAADVDTDATPSQFAVLRWNGTNWSATIESGTPSTNATSISDQHGFGDFVIGNPSLWYNSTWPRRLAITIDHGKVAGALTNFPVLISLTNSSLQQYAQTNGNDLLFTSSDGTTKLAHEIESYNRSNGALVAWVKAPVLSATTDTLLYLYCGNPSATNQQDGNGVWNSTFRAVWHLNGVFTDSSSNHYDGANNGTTAATGKISSGRTFVRAGGADYITVTGLLGSPANVTLSAWVNLDSRDASGAEIVSLGDHAAVRQDNTGISGFFYDGGTWRNTLSSTDVISTGWRYVVYTFDDSGNSQKVYVDGVQVASSTFSASISYSGLGANTLIGRHGNGSTSFDFDGSLDEVRVAQTARSADWVSTEFNNQNSPGAFHKVGSPQLAAPTKLAIASVNGGSSPVVGTAFNVVVQAQDEFGSPQNVQSNTVVNLSLNTGSGALGGTLTGTILAATNSVTISGITYNMAESGVSLNATRTSGDNLTPANSSPFTVNPGSQIITFPSPGDQTYGVSPLTLAATATSGLTVSYSVTSGPAAVSSNSLTITGAGSVTIQASQPGDANWNAATPVDQTISISPKAITGTITASNKTYDATAAATIATRSLSGVVGSDAVSLSGGTATFADRHVGIAKTVLATGLGLSGADAGNYVLTSTSATNFADITQATLTVNATGVNKVYDGTTNATVTLSDNRFAGDTLTTGYSAAYFADKNVGNAKSVSVIGISVTGPDSSNYAFNTTALATANIMAAVLTVTANDTNRPYGTPNPDFTASYSGFVNGENTNVLADSPVLSTTATTNSPPGAYPIQVSQGTLTSANYSFNFVSGVLTLNAVPLLLAIESAAGSGQTFQARIRGAGLVPDSLWHVLASTNFLQWEEIGTAQAAPDGTITFTDPDTQLHSMRFYRLKGN